MAAIARVRSDKRQARLSGIEWRRGHSCRRRLHHRDTEDTEKRWVDGCLRVVIVIDLLAIWLAALQSLNLAALLRICEQACTR